MLNCTMKRPSLHRTQSNTVLQAAADTVTTHDVSPSSPSSKLVKSDSQSSIRILRKSKSSPKLGQQVATAEPGLSKSGHRASGFASKFRFFKARRTESSSGFIDGLPSSLTSTLPELTASNSSVPFPTNSKLRANPPILHHPSHPASKLREAKGTASSRYHRANTTPSTRHVVGQSEDTLVGLGISDLRFDPRTGKYCFPSSSGGLPGAFGMERSRSSSGASSAGDSSGPRTPTELIPPLPDSDDLGKPFERASIDEADCQEVIGVLGSLFLGRDDEVAGLPPQSLDTSIAEGSSPRLQPVDSTSSVCATTPRRRAGSSTVNNTPIAYQSLPTRSSSLRGSKFNPYKTTLYGVVEGQIVPPN